MKKRTLIAPETGFWVAVEASDGSVLFSFADEQQAMSFADQCESAGNCTVIMGSWADDVDRDSKHKWPRERL